MAYFVWTKMQTESGTSLPVILALKEAERLAGGGKFWWGIGNSLGDSVRREAEKAGGTLPVLFSVMLSRPQKKDTHPEEVRLWTKWEDTEGTLRDLPKHVLEFSRANAKKDYHHALVCHSHVPLAIGVHGAFDPTRCKTIHGKQPGASQTTALLEENAHEDHSAGVYYFGFRATLIEPWVVKLRNPRKLTSPDLFNEWKQGWQDFISRIRMAGSRA